MIAPESESAAEGKLGDQIARQLEDRIRRGGWGDGHYLGSEESLAQAFGVSRSVFREAVAVGEWEGFVESRRGREGGLYVRGPTADAPVSTLRNYLFVVGTSLEELLRARRLLDEFTLSRAMQRMDVRQSRELEALVVPSGDDGDRDRLRRVKAIVDRVSVLAGLGPIGVFGASVRHCYVDRVRALTLDDAAYLRAIGAVAAFRRRQVEAMIALDHTAARDLQTRALDVWEDFQADLVRSRLTGAQIIDRLVNPGALIYEFVKPVKKTEAAARAIAHRIGERSLGPGDRLGVEADLILDLGVGRRVFREAVRILERFDIVEPGRGKFGGLNVGRPRLENFTRVMRRGPPPEVQARREDVLSLLDLLAGEAVRDRAGLPAIAPTASLAGFAASLAGNRAVGCMLAELEWLIADGAPRSLSLDDLAPLIRAFESGDQFSASRLMAGLVAKLTDRAHPA